MATLAGQNLSGRSGRTGKARGIKRRGDMKRIKIVADDKVYYAKPLGLGQLEELEDDINKIAELEKEAVTNPDKLPLELVRKQAAIVLIGLKNHSQDATEAITQGMSSREIGEALFAVLSGSGLTEVPEGNAAPGA
jgi:hypothetical protein